MQFAHPLVEDVAKLVNVFFLSRRNKQALQILAPVSCPLTPHLTHPRLLQIVERAVFLCRRRKVVRLFLNPMVIINLIKHDDGGLVRASQFLERLIDHLYLFLEVGMRDVDDVHKQIGLAYLVERRLE